MKYTKAFVIVALAAVAVAGTFLFLRPAKSPTAPSDWILQAATALNRASNAGNPHAGFNMGAGDPSSAQQFALEGQRLRVQRRFAEAQAMYQQAVRADPMNADAWADLADSAASAAGNDLTKGRDAIAHALAIDPHHRKALWLRASLELQEKQEALIFNFFFFQLCVLERLFSVFLKLLQIFFDHPEHEVSLLYFPLDRLQFIHRFRFSFIEFGNAGNLIYYMPFFNRIHVHYLSY